MSRKPLGRPELVRSPEVARALAEGAPVVALESTLLAHGLPAPDNRRIADQVQAAVREAGAVPATVAVLDGAVHVGLDPGGLDRVCGGGLRKLAVRDLPMAVATGGDGATTVSATALLAHQAGIAVFATGGLGGVHRGAGESFDESADLVTLARVPVTVVCAGVKSILDVRATLERLETLSVPLVGYRSDRFAGFYLADSGHPVPWRCDTPAQVARIARARDALGLPQAVVVANPIAGDHQLDPVRHEQVLGGALADAAAAGILGRDVTPFLLAAFNQRTGGASLSANVALVLANARLAGQIAGELAAELDGELASELAGPPAGQR